MVTPQSELTRLLGIPPELWEGELNGMSDEEISDLYTAECEHLDKVQALIRCTVNRWLCKAYTSC